jgi:hypothetical protein
MQRIIDSAPENETSLVANAGKSFQPQQIVLAHANLPTITHCYSQLIDIIQSRNLQTVTLNDSSHSTPITPVRLLDGLPDHVVDAAKRWECHIVEVITGLPPGRAGRCVGAAFYDGPELAWLLPDAARDAALQRYLDRG